jgi:hypothetical protein
MIATSPCVTITRGAPVAAIAAIRPGQSAWSEQREAAIERAAPARAAQAHPAGRRTRRSRRRSAVATACPAADGGASTSARASSGLADVVGDTLRRRQRDAALAIRVVQHLDRAVADDRADVERARSRTPARMRCALPNA